VPHWNTMTLFFLHGFSSSVTGKNHSEYNGLSDAV